MTYRITTHDATTGETTSHEMTDDERAAAVDPEIVDLVATITDQLAELEQ